MKLKTIGMGLLLLGVFFLFACNEGGSGSSDGTGTLSVGLADSATDQYQAVYITVDEVYVKSNSASPNDDKGWKLVASPKETYNLLNLINGVTAILGESELDAAHYNQVRLKLGKTPESKNNIFGNPHPYSCYVIFNDGDADTATIKELKVPSGYQSGIKLVHQFEIIEGEIVELVLDFDACRSVVQALNGDKCILKPTIKVIDTLDKSVVMGQVTDKSNPAVPLGGVSVSAQISDNNSARVVRTTLTDDGVDEDLETTAVEVMGMYELMLSPETSFNIVAFTVAKVSVGTDPVVEKMYSPACEKVLAPIDQIVERDFDLSPVDFGTVSGTVTVDSNGPISSDEPPAVYVTFYASLSCGYVEITALPLSPDTDGILEFSVDLPLGSYDVVASSEGYIPNTMPVAFNSANETATVNLNITEQPGS